MFIMELDSSGKVEPCGEMINNLFPVGPLSGDRRELEM